MPINENEYTKFLNQYAEELDIPPSKYQEAVKRYEAVGNWLCNGEYLKFNGADISIYSQGSFRLGTVTRPIKNSKECDYDIDLVCEFPINYSTTTPEYVKNIAGDRLKSNGTYKNMLEDEGRRCWTLNYSEQDGIGFHLDVLPSTPKNHSFSNSDIAITHKEDIHYSWSQSNPNGYANWFEGINKNAYQLVEHNQKLSITSKYYSVYSSIDSVPDQLVRTPLQRAIQIMKRHRDLCFDNKSDFKHRPISMIITTLSAHLYNGESDVFFALRNIVELLHQHAVLLSKQEFLDEKVSTRKLITRDESGYWYIPNPVNPEENFADRWHEDNNARAVAFFNWVIQIKADLIDVLKSYDRKGVRSSLAASLGVSFINKHFDSLWPLTNPKPHISTTQVNISQGQQPWCRDIDK